MMGAQDRAGSGMSGMPERPGGWSRGAGGGEARRGPGIWAAVLAFGLLVVMAVGSLKILREREVGPADPAPEGAGPAPRMPRARSSRHWPRKATRPL